MYLNYFCWVLSLARYIYIMTFVMGEKDQHELAVLPSGSLLKKMYDPIKIGLCNSICSETEKSL